MIMSDTARSFSPMPEKLEKFLDGYQESKVLFAACDFGIFDILRNSSVPQSAADITNMLSSNLDATTRLLHPCCFGVVRKNKTGGRVALQQH